MELKSKEELSKMSLADKKSYLIELEGQLNLLESGETLRKQSGGFQAAAEAMMPYDPTGAFNLMNKKAQTDIDRQRVMQQGQNKSRVIQLEQLWKDATRSLRQARIDRDQPSIAKYEAQIASLETQLSSLSPDTWGESAPKEVVVNGNVDKAISEGKDLIESAKDVKPRDGVIDDYAKIELNIKELVKKYNISDSDMQEVYGYLKSKADQIEKEYNSAKDTDREAYERNKATLDNKIQGWRPDVTAWKDIKRKAQSAITNYKNQNWGASQTITMKGLLGDALSEQERSVMAGKGYGESIFGGLWSKLTDSATPVTKEQAEKVVKAFVDYVNELGTSFGEFKNNKYVLDGLGLSSGNLAPLRFNSKNTEGGLNLGAPKKGQTKTIGGVTLTFDGKVWR